MNLRVGVAIVLSALAVGQVLACGIYPRTTAAASSPGPDTSSTAQYLPNPRAWDLYLSGPVVKRVHDSHALFCGVGPTAGGMLLTSYFELMGRIYDVAIRVTADRLAQGTYATKIDMSEVDVDNGTVVYAGSGSVHIVRADAQFGGSVEGSMAPIAGAFHSPPPLGALHLDGHWQCNQT